MLEYSKRLLLAIIITIIVSLLIIGGKQTIANAEAVDLENLEWIWPSAGVITDTYGTRNGEHYGIDIAGDIGSPVMVVADGIVTKSYYSNTYGNVVFIKHESGYETVYAHLSKRNVVEGEAVKKGSKIGLIGSTGNSSGPHLHLEVHKDSWTVSKENALDPFLIFGEGEIGQFVAAGVNKIVPVVEVANKFEGSDVYIVQAGDTLWSIAQKYKSTVDEIQQMNQLINTTIIPGQKLVVEKVETYQVKKGDTLFSIAKSHGLTAEQLKQINGIKTDAIYPNQTIIIEQK
ncbi:LysM peptidoglycan-binding domain-containing protein [Caldibacillus lycopersici]|uniref:LysM peptidoglycan-binding domain-containing protein n=1 Tax=Perspicuibacillus lycopersici TaxID=1325689 RepID=A0AAE3IT79_9BACI|nr:LysM peptidoglycan-binding domain-containing protein [Perspicuibacillus lycopersici]MCU9613742.1 LysM peptidoglycan-binding domain-containing protein [Perspicuibacillus lycopersici]